MVRWMARLARWHIWLGWLVGVPLILWTLSGLVMVARPIEVVRGEHLRIEQPPEPIPSGVAPVYSPGERPVKLEVVMQRGLPVTRATYVDGRIERYSALGHLLPPVTEAEARSMVAAQIRGGDGIEAVRHYPADDPPMDFRRPEAVWQLALSDGTHVYVGRHSGEIEAVRTRWWRLFDLMWGLHIMDLEEREDTSHPILILFAALALVGVLLGTTLLFRRRKAKQVPAPAAANQTSSG
jgi:hypothetical protein